MNSRFLSVLAGAATLIGAFALPSSAQRYFADHVETPASSVVHPGESGRIRTNVVILRTTPIGNPGAQPMGGQGPAGGLIPAQVLASLGVKAGSYGSNIIAIIDAYDNPNALKDFNAFSKQFNLPQETSTKVTATTNKVFQVVYQNGKKPASGLFTGWDVESALDIEWAHAMAPNAKIILFEAQDESDNLYLTVNAAVATAGVKEVSMSWGGGEFTTENTYDTYFPTGKGVTFFAATGDSGAWPAYGFLPIYPATSPNVIACGGTTVATDNNGKYLYQIPWGEGPQSGGGGGPSQVENRPSYQVGVKNTDPVYRSTPDIAAVADPYTGPAMYEDSNGGWFVVGGTSAATPILAGLVNAAGNFKSDSVAELTYLYKNAKTSVVDIQYGFNGYFALPGYDFATGLGVPKGLTGL